jgi:hypothetical protein
MATEQQNNNQSADNSTAAAEVIQPMPELGPNGNPISPPDGDDSPSVDADLVMSTFFDAVPKEPSENQNSNPASGQTKGSNDAGGQSQQGSLAPPQAAPAANGGEGSPDQSGPSSTQQTQGQQQDRGEGTGAQTPDQQPGSSDQQPSPQLSVEDRLALASVAALKEQNAQLLEQLRRQQEGGQQPQGQTGQGQQPQSTQPGAGQEQVQRLTVPDNIAAAVLGEDPVAAKQGMDLLITAVAHNAVQMAVARIAPMIDQKMGEVVSHLQAGTQVNQMEEQYFERFPHHKNELYRPLIQQVVDEKYKAFPGAKWDELMMDAVGSTVQAKLQSLGINPGTQLGPQQQQQQGSDGQNQTTEQKPNIRKGPAPMLDGSTRTGVPQDSADFIRNTFS